MTGQDGLAGPVVVVVLALVIVTTGGIAVDLWRVLEAHRRLSAVVDAAATAAAGEADGEAFRTAPHDVPHLEHEAAAARACLVLAGAGFAPCPSYQVTVDVRGREVTVTARQRVRFALIGRIAGRDMEIEAGATGRLFRLGGPAP